MIEHRLIERMIMVMKKEIYRFETENIANVSRIDRQWLILSGHMRTDVTMGKKRVYSFGSLIRKNLLLNTGERWMN